MKIINYIITILLLASPLCADDGNAPATVPVAEPQNAMTMPANVVKFRQATENEVQKKQDTESGNREIESAQYDENGRLDTVKYDDGTTVKYTYGLNENGELTSCTLSADNGVVMTLKNTNGSSEIVVNRKHSQEPEKGLREDDPVKITVSAPQDLENVSRKPIKFDFAEIGKVIDTASEKKHEAYNDYIAKTVDYYKNVADELDKISDSITMEGIHPNINTKDLEKNSDPQKREIIDNTVAYIRAEAAKDPDEKPVAVNFLRAEKAYRADFLEPHKKIYDSKLQEAVTNVNVVIDNLIKSKIAVYLNKNDDTIDAVINLPAKPTE